MCDKVVKCIRCIPVCQRAATTVLDTAVTELEAVQTASHLADWKRSLRRWGLPALRAGARLVRPNGLPPTFSAQDMRAERDPTWRRVPGGSNNAEAWKEQAAQAGMDPVPARQWNPRTFDRFKDALLDTAGAAGFDGWTKPELQAMLEHTP